jgi:hypothetical protein
MVMEGEAAPEYDAAHDHTHRQDASFAAADSGVDRDVGGT